MEAEHEQIICTKAPFHPGVIQVPGVVSGTFVTLTCVKLHGSFWVNDSVQIMFILYLHFIF